MNYRLLIILLFNFFPKKLCWHTGRIMDIKNLSFSGNSKIEKLFCVSNEQNRSRNNSIDAVICLRKNSHINQNFVLKCENATIIIHRLDCVNSIIKNLNAVLQRFPLLKWPSDQRTEISFSLEFDNKNGDKYLTKFIHAKKLLRYEDTRKEITVALDNNAKFLMTFILSIECDENYYGSNCDYFCKDKNKVYPNFNCTETVQRICLPGWKGIFCSEALCDDCQNGRCVGPGNCSCYRGWTGSNCEICEKSPGCMHGMCQIETGVLHSSKLRFKAFTCSCKPGWGGQNCDIDLKLCTNNPKICQNRGICHNYYGDQINHYLCQCSAGYSGRHCEMKTGDCQHDKIFPKNLSKILTPNCLCYPGFSGSHCQINDTLQNQIKSFQNSLKSRGYCVNSKEGFHCSCSNNLGGICKCRFLKCLNKEICIENNLKDIKCTQIESKNSIFEYFSNFRLENSTNYVIIPNKTDIRLETPKIFELQYFSSFLFIPLLLVVLIVVAIKFRYKFRRKFKTSIKTIHNDLGNLNNQVKQPVMFIEQRFLLNQRSLLNSLQIQSCKNNLLSIQDSQNFNFKSGDIESSKKPDEEDITKSDLLKQSSEEPVKTPIKESVICNPNLLINNYKNINESKL